MSRTVQPVDPLMLLRVAGVRPPMEGESAPPDRSSFLKNVTDVGFDGIEVVSSGVEPAGTAGTGTKWSKSAAAGRMDPATQAVGSGLHVGAVSAMCPTIDPCEAVEVTGTFVARAEGCGARCLNLRIAPLAGFGANDGFGGYQDAVNFVHVLLREIRPMVESAGVALAIEAARGGVLLSPVEMRDLIDGANSPALGVCLDVPTLARVGSPLDWIETLQGLVHAVRIAGDADTGTERTSDIRLGASARAGVDASLSAGTTATQLATSLREHGFGGVWIVAATGGETITTNSPASRIAHQVRGILGSHIA